MGSFDSDDQSASQDHCEATSHAPSNNLEHLANTSHRLPLKEFKGISQDRSVVENMRVGSFDSGQQAANPESPQHSLATP